MGAGAGGGSSSGRALDYAKPFQSVGKSLLSGDQGTGSSALLQNPLLGESEGIVKRGLFKNEYKAYAKSKMEGSMDDVRERSWSKSKRGKLERAIREDQIFKAESMAAMIRREQNSPENPVALKQRY